MLNLGKGFSIPDEAITETFGILAARGAGKSNTATVMAEEMFANELPFVVVDPVGSWWGMRSSKTGSGAGLDIPLFGGKRGDVPLERTGGRLIADIVVDERLSCILDLTMFDSEAAKKQFLLDFSQRLYKRNEEPLHLFLEEADDYIPQRPMSRGENSLEPQVLRAFENIVRRGRGRGLGMTMITQRSASINKNVLTQVQTLIAMRTTGPQDRKAIEEWVKYNDQSREILATLPGLANGQAWVWSPQFLKCTKQVKFRRRHTFDSGSTPKMAAKSKTARLADVDVSRLRDQMADTIKRAEDTDPKILKQRIRILEKEIKLSQKDSNDGELEVLRENNSKLVEYVSQIEERVSSLRLAQKSAFNYVNELLEMINPDSDVPTPPLLEMTTKKITQIERPSAPRARALATHNASAVPPQIDSLGKAQVAILRAFWWLRDEEATKNKLAFYAGYSSKSSHIGNVISSLRTAGLVSGWRITEAGEAVMSPVAEAKPTGPELREWLRPKLGGAANTILDVLILANGESVSEDAICERSGYSRTSSHFGNVLSRLRSIGAAEGYARDGGIKAAAVFFE